MKDAWFVIVTAVFFVSLWNMLSIPEAWLPAIGLYVTGQIIVSTYRNLVEEGEEDGE